MRGNYTQLNEWTELLQGEAQTDGIKIVLGQLKDAILNGRGGITQTTENQELRMRLVSMNRELEECKAKIKSINEVSK